MASKEKVIVQIDKDGGITVKVEGVKGRACKALTNDMEKALGVVTATKATAEAFQREEHAKHTHTA